MSAPQRVQLRRTKGWRKPEGAVVVARPSKWGNPFEVGELVPAGDPPELQRRATRSDVVEMFGDYAAGLLIAKPRWTDADLAELRGKDLACWCPEGQPCHADVLIELANR